MSLLDWVANVTLPAGDRGTIAAVLDAIPDGWLKLDGQWSHIGDDARPAADIYAEWLERNGGKV